LLPLGLKVAIPSTLEVSGDVIAAAATLAGLILVFLGAISTSYDSYDALLRTRTLRARFQRRGWFAFVGFALALSATLLALLGKWFQCNAAVLAAIICFVVALIWALVAGALSVRDIK
jgi:tellurite resistance protein TehA-like permease